MKRVLLILMLCSLLLIAAGTVYAAEPGYERISYATQVWPTIDGEWTSTDEWTDGDNTTIGDGVVFKSTWDFETYATTRWLVEFLNDTSDDADDYWEMCIDCDQSGGTAPSTGDFRFVITGHDTLVWYEGDGSGWSEVSLESYEIEWAASLTDTPTESTPHWVLEFNIAKNNGTVQIGILWNFRLAVYDDSNSGVVVAWPPTDANVPDEWGIENYSSDYVPEGFTFAVMVFLSSVALIVGSRYIQKRSKKKEQ